jgi:hypothetical protein
MEMRMVEVLVLASVRQLMREWRVRTIGGRGGGSGAGRRGLKGVGGIIETHGLLWMLGLMW